MKSISTKKIHFVWLLLLGISMASNKVYGQYVVNTAASAEELVNALVGEGVEVSNVTSNCNQTARGIFNGTGDLGIDSGIVMTSGTAEVFGAYLGWGFPSAMVAEAGDADLNTIVAPRTTDDACVLEFDFIPSGDSIRFNYVFGSSEYGGWSCSNFNDVFAFFISGPGIAGNQNIAVIPGTTIPVSVNSTTGVGAWVTADPDCTGMGPGSPFVAFYVDNTSGAFVRYGGFTTVFTAEAAVSPCNTYHLKLAIADVNDDILDSGVFLEANSLHSNGVTVSSVGGGGMSWPNTNAVRGCTPAAFNVTRSGSTAAPITLTYTLGGTAVNGIDYVSLPGTVTIPAGAAEAAVLIDPIVFSSLVGTRTVIPRIVNPFSCGDTITADTIYIYDSLHVIASVQDTMICLGQSVNIEVTTHPFFDFAWSETAFVTMAPDMYHVAITPTESMEYVLSVNVIGSGCDNVTDTIDINVVNPGILVLEDSVDLCLDDHYFIVPEFATPTEDPAPIYTWTPGTYLSDPSAINPIAFPITSTNYVLDISYGLEGCGLRDSIYINVIPDQHIPYYDTICADMLPYLWEGMSISSGGADIANVSYPSSITGCDSITHLHLYVLPELTETEHITICNSELPYTWNGNIIAAGGTGVSSFASSSLTTGCDSTTILNLFVNPDIEVAENITICEDMLPYSWNGNTVSSGGAGIAVFTTNSLVNGCDSTTTLNLTISDGIILAVDHTICSTELPYLWNGIAVSAGGTGAASYTTVSSLSGCDSVTYLNLYVTPVLNATVDTSVCATAMPFVWNGLTISTGGAGTASYTGSSSLTGCDSITTLSLTVIPTIHQNEDIVICEGSLPYFWNGMEVNSAGTDVASYSSISSASGCDSVTHLNLTVTGTSYSDWTATICFGSAYDFNGTLLTAAGSYSDTLTGSTGCDSILTLNLYINPLVTDTVSATICSGSEYIFYGSAYNTAGTFEFLSGTGGCDTLHVLNLAVADTLRTFAAESICHGGSISIAGTTISSAGTYPFYYTTSAGCDSLYVLTVTVAPIITDTIHAATCSGTGYAFYGSAYHTAGVYEHLATTGSCDTLHVLNLSITDTVRTFATESICHGGSLTIGGIMISSAGSYPFHYLTSTGCDSLHTLTVYIAPIMTDTTSATICPGHYYSFFGSDYHTSGTYTSTATAGDCDTIFVLHLTVTDTIRTYGTETICSGGSITIGSTVISSAGTYPLLFSTAEGCDSLHTLTVIVAPLISDTTIANICSGAAYEFYGSGYTAPGIYTYTLLSGACDTLFVLDLDVSDTIRTASTETICEGGTITIGSTSYTSAGTYAIYATTAGGCDSLHTLSIIVDPVIPDSLSIVICEDEVYDFYGTTISESGIYTYLDISGSCDTARVLTLNVNPSYSATETLTLCSNELPYTFMGLTIPAGTVSTSGYTTIVMSSTLGCDSLIHIDLIIHDTAITELDTVVCYGTIVHFGDLAISSAGLYTQVLTTSNGCDSVVNLSVTYTPQAPVVDSFISGCGSVTYDGVEYESSAVFTDTFRTVSGCDSLYRHVNIEILYAPKDTISATICEGDKYHFNGVDYYSSTTITQSYVYHNGCDSFITLDLQVYPQPLVRLTYGPVDELLCVYDTVRLYGHGAALYHYFDRDYQPLGSGDHMDALLTHALNNYFVIGYDMNGCSAEATVAVKAEACCEMLIPNAFTPNGDGLNDAFGVITAGHPADFRIEVFNRWGERIFISYNPNTKWNGTYGNSQAADAGTYFYTVQGRCYDGSIFRKKGDVTLIR